jgi:hypothetical protein
VQGTAQAQASQTIGRDKVIAYWSRELARRATARAVADARRDRVRARLFSRACARRSRGEARGIHERQQATSPRSSAQHGAFSGNASRKVWASTRCQTDTSELNHSASRPGHGYSVSAATSSEVGSTETADGGGGTAATGAWAGGAADGGSAAEGGAADGGSAAEGIPADGA